VSVHEIQPPLNELSNDGTKEKLILFSVKPYGIDWFDEIVQSDEIIKIASCPPNLAALDKRLDELEAIHNVKRLS
jgi:hypothetical protein